MNVKPECQLLLINKKKKTTCYLVDFAMPGTHRLEIKESERWANTGILPESWKKMKHENDGNTTCIWTVWFGISTLFRLFNVKAILQEEQLWYYLTHSWEDKGVHTFPKGICPKVNVIARLEYELAYYDSAVHRFNHYTTRTLPCIWTVHKDMEKSLRELKVRKRIWYK